MDLLGNGLFDGVTWFDTYNSSYATNYSANVGGSVYANRFAIYVAQGFSAPAADAKALDWCARLAREVALIDAYDAADITSAWITIGAYGTGASPILAGVGNTVDYAVRFNNYHLLGGWKIRDIDIQDYKWLGIDMEFGGGTPKPKGMWIENVNVTNINGGNQQGGLPTPFPLSNTFAPTALMHFRVDNVFARNCSFSNSGVGVIFLTGDALTLDTCNVDDNGYGGIAWSAISNVLAYPIGGTGKFGYSNISLVKDCTFNGNGVIGKPNGTVGVFMTCVLQCSISGCTIDGTIGPASPDRVALDLEYGLLDVTIRNSAVIGTISSNEGSFALVGTQSVNGNTIGRGGTIMDSLVIHDNGTINPTGLPALTRYDYIAADTWDILLCDIHRDVAGQKLFGDRLNTPGALTDTPPPGWLFPLAGLGQNTVTG